MKKVIFFAACLLSLSAMAQDQKMTQDQKNDSLKSNTPYCATMKDGIMILTSQGKQLSSEVILPNGTRVSADGIIKTKDGVARHMSEGECIDLANSTAAAEPYKREPFKKEPLR